MKIKRLGYLTAILLLAAACLLLTSCAAQYSASDEAAYDMAEPEQMAEYDDGVQARQELAPMASGTDPLKEEAGGAGETAPRRIIRNGSIELTVKDTRETMAEIRKMADGSNGIVSDSYIYETREDLYNGYMTVRIPENHFDRFMEQLEELGKAANIETSQTDITMQYVDLESRLNNQKAQEERLIEIMEMADTVEEILEVERELYRVRGEIESMTAQFTYMRDQVAYSTITVSLREESIPTESISPLGFQNIGSRISQAFIGSINFLLNTVSFLIVAAVALIPVMFLLAVPVLLIWLLVRKRVRRKAAVKTEEE